jgi:phosphoenolpyruvate carboxylase
MMLLQARVATLWQTRMLRYEKLTVADEIENALSYYRTTFLRELPALYDDIEDELQASTAGATYLQMGSWIGGDRDGNPNVNAGTMQRALVRHATTIFDFYLDEVHALGAELSTSTLLVPADAALRSAGRRPRPTPRRTAATSLTGAP